jgi:hypothetical protein
LRNASGAVKIPGYSFRFHPQRRAAIEVSLGITTVAEDIKLGGIPVSR